MKFSRGTSRTVSMFVVLGTVMVLLASTFVGVSAAGGGGEKPKAEEIGITDDEIRIAVVADVENQLVPGLFQQSVDGVRAWATGVNKNGGLAGRKVVIDFIDSHLSPDDARNAIIKACTDDFAMVGGQALFMNNVDDMVACTNKEGQPVGLPDLPGLALEPAQKCSGLTYVATGDQQYCATKDDHPQTYYPHQGDFLYYLKQDKNLHGVFTVPTDLKATRDSVIPQVQSGVDLGIKGDGEGFYDTSARATQSAMTPIIRVVQDNNSNFVYNSNANNLMVFLRKEAKLQGVTSVKYWACNQGCYDQVFLDQGGADVEDTYAVTYTLPFYSEYKSNPTMKALVNQLGGPDEINANGIASLVASLLFQRAVEDVVKSGDTLNRETLLGSLDNIHDFDADGIIGATDIGNHKASPCYIMSQVQDGKWQRVYPKKVGTFDCNKKNINKLELDLTEG
jgi:ABC-type branched-subunit amino acid transport system substrate-binding protein